MTMAIRDLHGEFFIRHPWPLWTSRHFLNGVVELEEAEIPDAILEYVIRGVMNDIRGALISNGLRVYERWTDIIKTPVQIRRATTYGTVANLYAREIELTGVIAGIRPIALKFITSMKTREQAMDYWEARMEKALFSYISSTDGIIMKVDTQDEDPVFTMDDIPLYKIPDP